MANHEKDIKLARSLYDAEDYQSCIRMLNEFKEEHACAELHSLLALAYEAIEDFNSAISCLTSAINIESKEASHFYRRGRIQLCFLGREYSQTGIADLVKCVDLDSKIAMAHYLLCLEYLVPHAADMDAAFFHLNRLFELAPELPSTLYCAGQYYSTCGQFKKALEFLELGSQVDSEYSATIFSDIASARKSLQTAKDAVIGIEAITSALDLEPTSHRYCIRASLHLFLNNLTEAKRDFAVASDFPSGEIADEYLSIIQQKIASAENLK